MTNPICVDLSHHNPTPDWAALKAGGTLGVILKATEGTTYTDPTFATRFAAAKAAGLSVCSYQFLKHGNVDQQMSYYLDVVDPEDGERVVIDYEDTACTIDDLTAAVAYLQGLDLNLQITVYGASKLTDDARGHAAQLAGTSLWAARYSTSQPVIATDVWPSWSLWQYTDKATVAGISAPVDGNQFNGSADNFVAWMGPAAEPVPAPGPTPGPEPVAVLIDIQSAVGGAGVAFEITVNGVRWVPGVETFHPVP